jgi:DNA invertase Pin-like site-specific DNA recombinase
MSPADRWPALNPAGASARPLVLVGYTRLAIGDRDGDLQRQASAISKASRDRCWQVRQIVAERAPGGDLNRRILAATLNSVRRGDYNGLVVARLDRLICSLAQFRHLFDDACQSGWVLVVIDAGIDLSTPAGSVKADELARAADYDRQLTSMRTAEALAAKRLAAMRLGRPRTCPDGVLERVARLRVSGATLTSIAEELNEDVIPTPGGGRQWYASHVSRLLKTQDARFLLEDLLTTRRAQEPEQAR